jgi:glutaconate CoA-transferase subunit A
MAEFVSLKQAIAGSVRDGDMVALEGFTHLIPFAAGHEIVRQGRTDLHLVRMTPDLIYDQLIGMGCAAEMTFSWGGNPGVGSLHRLRDAIERDWPRALTITEHSHAAMATAYQAGASNLPFAVLRGYLGTDHASVNPNIRSVECPFTGEKLAAVPALRPDVGIIHAQRADRKGNVQLWGIVGVQKEVVLSAKRAIVTVEEIVDDLRDFPNGIILPSWTIAAIAVVPGGAYPSYAHGYYPRSNPFYTAWDDISKDRERFREWMRRHILSTDDFECFRRSIADASDEVRA